MPNSKRNYTDVKGFERAMSRLKAAQKVVYVKIIHNMWSKADKIAEWHDEMETTCLRCKGGNESVDRLLSCKSQHTAVAFKQATQKRYHTVPIIVSHLVRILRIHRVGYNAPMEKQVFLNPIIRTLTKVYDKQLRLGTLAHTNSDARGHSHDHQPLYDLVQWSMTKDGLWKVIKVWSLWSCWKYMVVNCPSQFIYCS